MQASKLGVQHITCYFKELFTEKQDSKILNIYTIKTHAFTTIKKA